MSEFCSAQARDRGAPPPPPAPEPAAAFAPVQRDGHERRFLVHDVIDVVLPGPFA